jgi:hypothetical protein
MTLNEKIQRVRDYIDEQSEANFSNSFIIQSLNSAQDEVQSELVKMDVGYFEKPALINPNGVPPGTTPGVDRYLLPDDFLLFRRVEYKDSNQELTPIDLNEKTVSGGSLASRLMQVVNNYGYYRSGKDLVIDPTPTTAFEVRMIYVYLLPRMTTTTDGAFVNEMPAQFHDMECVSAAMDCKIKDEAKLADLQNKWDRHMHRLQTTIGAWQTQVPKMVGGSKNL